MSRQNNPKRYKIDQYLKPSFHKITADSINKIQYLILNLNEENLELE